MFVLRMYIIMLYMELYSHPRSNVIMAILYVCTCRFVDQIFSSLEPVFVADPLLLYDFIFICPEFEYTSLFKKIPAYLSLTRLSQNRSRSFTYGDVDVSLLQYILKGCM